MQPEISVIITSYNTAGYITRALESALAQEGVSLEVIIVDDVSSDNSWEVISALTDPRIKKLQLERNSGPSGARNAAIALASGQWLAVLDSDDTYEPGRLARLLALARDKKADIAVDNLLVYREADGASFPMFASLPATLDLAAFIRGNQAFLSGFTLGYLKPIFSRAFLQQHQLAYDPEIRIGEDYFLLASALALGAVCVADATPGYRYTVRQGSISHRLKLADVERIMLCDAKLKRAYKLDAASEAAQLRREKNLQDAFSYTEALESLKSRDLLAALRHLISRPSAAVHFWLPIRARLERYFGLKPL